MIEHLTHLALPLLILLPLTSAALAFALGPGRGASLVIASSALQLLLALLLAATIGSAGPSHHAAGGWGAPLGIDLVADGLAAAMLLLTQGVALALFVFARGYFHQDSQDADHWAPAGRYFWPLASFLVAGMNALYLSEDIFNLYVTLELVGLAAVGLVASGGGATQTAAALRYLFAAILGSGAYLLGVALLYGSYGSVSIAALTPAIAASAPAVTTVALVAALLMVTGLLIKSALFPFHFWLPPAHGGSPAPVSALLSALVVKASIYLVLRLWLGPLQPLLAPFAWLPAILGASAILWGSWQAIRAERLKLLVAYSTVAQLGYLFIALPLAAASTTGVAPVAIVTLQAVAHGLAKAAMFAAAGIILHATGRDRVSDVAGIAERLPLTLFTFALAGVSLMGLPPSGGFLAKWLLIDLALAQGQWWLVAVIIAGGLLAAVYIFRVLRQAFLNLPEAEIEAEHQKARVVPRSAEWAAFALAASSILLGIFGGVPLLQLVGGSV
ncbi:MAG: proton-conducting transporter membrane subunit [Rhodocyclaceae bacterium]|nr:proton-conducting transporter membrane subunit [Rhodocyclaceae bacterium]